MTKSINAVADNVGLGKAHKGNRKLWNKCAGRLKIGSYSTKRLKKSLEGVRKLTQKMDILFLCETWMRTCDEDLTQMEDEFIYASNYERNEQSFWRNSSAYKFADSIQDS